MPVRSRVLYVAMHHSIHVARWLRTADASDFERHMFPLDPNPHHPDLRNLTLHVPTTAPMESRSEPQVVRDPPADRSLLHRAGRWVVHALREPGDAQRILKARIREKMSKLSAKSERGHPVANHAEARISPVHLDDCSGVSWQASVRLGREDESENATTALHGPRALARVIRAVQPDLIHSMEFQHAAYLVLATRDYLGQTEPGFRFPKWLATNWGSDIYYFGRDEGHARQIRRVCETVDLYSCECHRDLQIGRSFGYRGPDLPVLPNSGGMDVAAALAHRDPAPPSKRKTIMVKGYDHFAGRAMLALSVLERFAERLKGYEIVLFSVSARPRTRALELKAAGRLNIRVIDYATHEEILAEFGRARIYLAVSISDGISTSVLEAMLMGAFPIQTNTSCCEEWFVDGETGFAVPHDDIEKIAARFERALSDDELVDEASARNLEIIRTRVDNCVLGPRIAEFYRQALAAPRLDDEAQT